MYLGLTFSFIKIINLILTYALFLGAFFAIYSLSWIFVKKSNDNIKFYYEIILGFLFGALTLIGQELIINFNDSFSPYIIFFQLPFIFFWIFYFFLSWLSATTFISTSLGCIFLVNPFFPNAFFEVTKGIILINYASIFIITTIISFVNYKYKLHFFISWTILMALSLLNSLIICFLMNYYLIINIQMLMLVFYSVLWIFIGYVSYGMASVIDMVYKHAVRLQSIVSYEQNNFLKEALAKEYIYSYINRNNFQYGMYLTIFIKDFEKLENKLPKEVTERLLSIVSDSLVTEFKELQPIFFKADKNAFGVFIGIKEIREINIKNLIKGNTENNRKQDYLASIETKIKKVPKVFKIKDIILKTKTQSVLSFYGIQSNDLDLLKNTNILIKNNVDHYNLLNTIVVNDISIIKNISLINRSLLALSEQVNLESITPMFNQILDLEKKRILGHYCTSLINGGTVDLGNPELKNLSSECFSVLERIAAVLNLKKFRLMKNHNEYLLFIRYSANYLESYNFSIKYFTSKLIDHKINPKNICLYFDLSVNINNFRQLQRNIQKLKGIGVKIAIINLGEKNNYYSLLEFFQPDFAFIYNLVIKNLIRYKTNEELIRYLIALCDKLKIILIAPEVNSYIIHQKLIKLNINYMSGKLIGIDTSPNEKIRNEFLVIRKEKDGINEIKK